MAVIEAREGENRLLLGEFLATIIHSGHSVDGPVTTNSRRYIVENFNVCAVFVVPES